MHKILIKNILIVTLPIIAFGSDFAFSHRKFYIKNKEIIESYKIENNLKSNINNNEISVSSQNNVYDNLIRNFENYPSFEESMEPANQFQNLFRNNDRILKKATFRLWETYEKEMSKQIGSERLNGPDINNTINESLNSLSE